LYEIAERHVELLDALRSGNPDCAEAAIHRHIAEPADWIRSAYQREQVATRKARTEMRSRPRRKVALHLQRD
jgi:FCD domain